MYWNDGIERKKFERCQMALAEKYRAAGMTEEQIQEMYEFDLAVYRKERIFYTHTQPLEIRSNEGEESIGEISDFISERTQFETHGDHYNRYWWIDELENLFFTVMSLTDDEKELVTLYVFEGYTQKEIANIRKCTQSNVCQQLHRIKNKLLSSQGGK